MDNPIVKADNEGNLIIINRVTDSQIIIKIELKGKTGRKVLNIGTINPTTKCFELKRKRTKHLHRKSNSYGFNHYILSTGQLFDYILLTDEHGTYKIPVSVILAGVLLKMGTYGLLRISYPLLPGEVYNFAYALALLGVINIIWGAANAIAQVDLKKMVAYSSISHMGYVLLGMAAIIGNNRVGAEAGINGAVMQMFNHGTITAMLFLLVGVIYDRAHHRYIIYPKDHEKSGELGFGGLNTNLPVYGGFVALAFFAGLGLPALSGFISEAMCFIGGFSVFRTLTIIGTLGILLNAIYFLRAYQRIFLGPLNETYKDLTDISRRELVTIVPLAALVLIFGVYPAPLINMMAPAMDGIIKIVKSVI